MWSVVLKQRRDGVVSADLLPADAGTAGELLVDIAAVAVLGNIARCSGQPIEERLFQLSVWSSGLPHAIRRGSHWVGILRLLCRVLDAGCRRLAVNPIVGCRSSMVVCRLGDSRRDRGVRLRGFQSAIVNRHSTLGSKLLSKLDGP